MAMSNYETSCTSTFLCLCTFLVTRGVHAYAEVWLTPELWGDKIILFLVPHSFSLKVKFHFVMQTDTITLGVLLCLVLKRFPFVSRSCFLDIVSMCRDQGAMCFSTEWKTYAIDKRRHLQ